MRFTLQDRLLRRELGDSSRYTTVKALYGDRAWIDDLDIVNELGGHSGCVNALSWSSSGRLLASGSDDLHLNIHSYQPESSVSQFSLTTTVTTGHSANIFSVKFMPHSNDSTLVTCAGDHQVRVFDIEYSSQSSIPSVGSNQRASSDRGAKFSNLYKGVRYLNYGDTSARIYRSHTDRVKRIVTESSPNLFLTCSEDGEVRQFDLRLPSTAYPAPSLRGGRSLLSHRRNHDDTNVPPPLISYKRFHLYLNTISCSASQPHYIALGGTHLHCFLHDRRMLGRDLLEERGYPGSISPAGSTSSRDDELMGQATQCVRKFAPNGRRRMRRTDNGHITACKISDANPNEMIVSWSADNIYSFDLVKSPDASENTSRDTEGHPKAHVKGKMKESTDRKRKRNNQNPSTSLDAARRSSKPRQKNTSPNDDGDLSIRVRYENGQSEDIAMDDHMASAPASMGEDVRDVVLTESQKRSLRIAKSVVKVRLLMFSLDAQTRTSFASADVNDTTLATQFTSVLGIAATSLPEMDDIIRDWRYPLDPSTEDILFQQTNRLNREASRRFVQAAGTLAKLLGGRLQTASRGSSQHVLELFHHIGLAPRQGPYTTPRQTFSHEFLKAISLWLDGGAQALLQGFKRPETQRLNDPRFPVPEDTQLSGVDDYIIPYLLRLAQDNPIPNVDASRFERDADRQIFESEKAAVIAFSHAIRIPLEDLSRAITLGFSSQDQRPMPQSQDRRTAMKFWGFKVGRGLLMTAAEGINFQLVDTAFGGLGIGHVDEGRVQDDIDPDEMEDVVESVNVVKRPTHEPNASTVNNGEIIVRDVQTNGVPQMDGSSSLSNTSREPTAEVEEIGSDAEVVLMDDIHNEIAHHIGERYEEEDVSNEEEDEEDDGDEDEDEDEEITAEERQLLFQSASDRGKLRESVEKDVTCSSHTRQYTGHCNVKTVKDANFFGLQDEYVVSGSDSGHLFIWDKKTSELVNILKGDGEVVNVVQGHPYEPLLAVSGIDNTIKIFSPDSQAQDDARAGINIGGTCNDSSGYNSTSQRRRRARDHAANGSESGSNDQGLSSRKCMQQSYQIISQNDLERQGDVRNAFITRGMLAQLAARLQARHAAGGAGEDDGVPVVVDDSCAIM